MVFQRTGPMERGKSDCMATVYTVADEGTIIDFEATLDRYRRYGSDLANRFHDGVFSKVVRTARPGKRRKKRRKPVKAAS